MQNALHHKFNNNMPTGKLKYQYLQGFQEMRENKQPNKTPPKRGIFLASAC
jgi:hypothetical protein